MELNKKNIFNCILLLVSMLLCFDICFQENSNNSVIELSAENNLNSDCIDSDSELNEEGQIIFAVQYFLTVEQITHHNHFHFTNRFSLPFFSVWQPPKLS